MSDRYIHIRNWDLHQHPDATRNRKSGAPWIKDYTAQLHDDDWLQLTDAQRGLLQRIRLEYASRRGRGLVEDAARPPRHPGGNSLKTFRHNLEALNQAGFIYFSASKVASESASKPASDVASLEVEREREKTQGLTEANYAAANGRQQTTQDLTPDLEDIPF